MGGERAGDGWRAAGPVVVYDGVGGRGAWVGTSSWVGGGAGSRDGAVVRASVGFVRECDVRVGSAQRGRNETTSYARLLQPYGAKTSSGGKTKQEGKEKKKRLT